MIEKLEGIVITERAYSETSKIINIITKEHGIISCLAKGSRSLKSDLRIATTKLTYGFFNVIYKENKLSTLVSVDIINSFKIIKSNLTKISYASFIVDLTEQVIKQSYSEDIYINFVASLIKIEENFDPLVITNVLELKYLYYLGVMPIIDECSVCKSKNSIATLSSEAGGYVCNKCLTTEKIVSEKTIKIIRMFYYLDISKISNIDISSLVKNEINEFLDNYYEKYTGLYLKSKSFLKNISKIEMI